jgi:hypothetical protein
MASGSRVPGLRSPRFHKPAEHRRAHAAPNAEPAREFRRCPGLDPW